MITISHLPNDLLDYIFSRIPLKYTRSLRLTCKNWDNLLKNRRFGKDVTTTNEGESPMIVLMDNHLYLMSIVVNRDDPYTEQKGKLIFLNDDSDQVKISQVFHCKGLLLCILKDKFSLVVWNPYWGKTSWIEPKYSYRPHDRYMYALGYDNKRRCHKILRFIDMELYYPRNCIVLCYEIYDFESDLWTTLNVNPYWLINSSNRSVSLKGNAYWCGTKRKSHSLDVDHIICFDFTSERFGPLLRLPFRATDESIVSLSCVREEKLAAFFLHKYGVEVWITTKIEAKKVLWSRFLNVNLVANIPSPVTLGSFFIDEAKRVAMIFDKTSNGDDTIDIMGEAGYVKQVGLGEPSDKSFCPLVCSYVPSLVPIKQLEGGRKQQSESEKRRCDQNMSRLVPYEEPLRERYAEAGKRRKLD